MTNRKNILIVDDVPVNRRILKHILNDGGFNTVEANNGREALNILLDEKSDIALVLLDLTMPVMDGFELMRIMKEKELINSVPVIVTTVYDNSQAEVSSLSEGASDFIAKPYKPDIVCHRVRSILRLRENAAFINQIEKDRLTGLYSREFFYRHAEEMLAKNPDVQYDILVSNIEHFKMINSKYGVKVGDELLKCIAQHHLECVGADGVCGRLGADTFVALRKKREPRSQEVVGESFMETYKNAPVKNFAMQYGLYHIDDREISVSEMCDCAQLALATIKYKYGVYYAIYDDSIRQKFLRENQLSDHMERALEERQFLVYMQPKHEIESEKIAGAEALVRWIHPELGFISPGEFIPLFERNGFITKLDRYVLEEVCRVLHGWIKSGTQAIPVSVNVSRADFEDNDLPELINTMVEKYEIPHELLHFEVTESAYTDNPQQIISAVSTLRDMGFLIEMDDFGSGYSSLNMLSELPIDILKLDMRFVQKTGNLSIGSKRSILSFIVSLSKWLQFPTIAEGVETKEDVDLLKSMGCNYIQGYYFAKPMPVKDFETYMQTCRQKALEAKPETCENAGDDEKNSASSDKPLVMAVEDIAGNRAILKDMLAPYYTVVEASNGQEAYDYLKTHHTEVSCMLLDLLMPVMDGFQLIEHMRKDGFLSEIPVIITSEASNGSELRSVQLGAYSFVAKPYEFEVLLHNVKNAVNEYSYRKLCK